MDPDELLKQLRVLRNGVLAGPDSDIIIHGATMPKWSGGGTSPAI